MRAITPRGTWESRRLPGSGAGPSPDRVLIGSEGILGVIAEAWVRVRPAARVQGLVRGRVRRLRRRGASGARDLAVRLSIRPTAACSTRSRPATTGAGTGEKALLILGFESRPPSGRRLDGNIALAIAREHGGRSRADGANPRPGATAEGDGEARSGAWRSAFLLAPYLRDTFVACGVLSETFETAITWDRFEEFHADDDGGGAGQGRRGLRRAGRGPGAPRVSCRFTHVYPDGPAPYFTVMAPAVRGGEVEQWDEIKAAASEAVIEGGGTITHHHAVGRDHRPWYDRQRPAPFAAALRAAKAELDPAGDAQPRRPDRPGPR